MKRSLVYTLIFFSVLSLFSCKKETSFENSGAKAAGSLQSDITDECLPKTVIGTYIAGKALNDSNYIQVDVNVTNPGSYTITTDTTNGYSFNSTGTFSASGTNTITLKAKGTPLTAGTNLFVISFDSSFCLIQVAVLPASAGGPATFTLQGSPTICMNSIVSGTYVKAVALNSGNKVDIQLNVTAIGTYSISTTSTNGMTFSGSGTLAATGTQTISLAGSGTPVNSGPTTITVTAGGGSCSFIVNVSAAPPTGDYFPLTQNSYWTYSNNITADTIMKKSTTQVTIAGNSYRVFEVYFNTVLDDTSHFRKAGNDYYQRLVVDTFTSIYLDDYQFNEILFLKENAPVGTTWQSPIFSGKDSGNTVSIQYTFTIEAVNISLNVNGVNYNNVIKVAGKSQLNYGTGFVDDIGIESYYAQGIGLIRFRLYDPAFPSNQYIENLRYYQVL
ncbi:MAG: hypothetical protein M3O67_03555 [Bacteroidota bacterium]|nr:hypothetical protein [Bacteroidota bacterium]